MPNPPDIPQAQIDALFPLRRDPLGVDVFELGLVLGGTVSAGAYTAGVLDYLMEALDAWTHAREQKSAEAPPHRVVISTIAGASGGAINGAILARAAGWSFDHGASKSNPFYTSWTTGVDLMKLLSTSPEPRVTGFASLLNCAAIDDQATQTISFKGGPLGQGNAPVHRSYLADPLRLAMMIGNVTGVPYRIPFAGESGLGHDLIAHADMVRFALTVDGGVPNPPGSRPDEYALSSKSEPNWDLVKAAALATSAFPGALRSRAVSRTLETAGWRVIVIPGENSPAMVRQLVPNWDLLAANERLQGNVDLVSVDGGCFNNEPLDVVRAALAGWDSRNKRGGAEADRAVVLIDPFSDPDQLGPTLPPSLFALIGPLAMSFVFQARFKPADIALADKPDIYSRFLIAPVGAGATDERVVGKAAIAAGGLGGFLGFVSPAFLDYDYKLGRRNAYDFLAEHLAFPAANPIFANWTDAQKADQTVPDPSGGRFLRMIPLMKDLRDHPPPRPTAAMWPKLAAFPPDLSGAIEKRLDAIYALVMAENRPDSWWKQLLTSWYVSLGWKLAVRGALRDKAIDAIRHALVDQKLL